MSDASFVSMTARLLGEINFVGQATAEKNKQP
jgi:hypothetical protein